MATNYFANVIGQEALKRHLTFLLDSHKAMGITDNILFCAKRGMGKTMISRSFARNIKAPDGKTKRFIEVNAGALNVEEFFTNLVIPYMINNHCVIHLDEVAEIKKPLEVILLTILQPCRENVNHVLYDGVTYVFDFNLLSFICSTTNPEKLGLPLRDRLTRIEFEEYKDKDLIEILKKSLLVPIKFDNDILPSISGVLRGNPRMAVSMAKRIGYYCGKDKSDTFGMDDWKKLKYHLNIKPMGLLPLEMQALRVMSQHNGMSLTHIAACLGLNSSTVRTDVESYLLSQNLMKIDQKRYITDNGMRILKESTSD